MNNNALAALAVRLFATFSLVLFSTLSIPAYSAAISGQGAWETTLLARDLDGDTSTIEAYYDTAQEITWLADANYAQTSGFDADGLMTWYDSNAWAAGLTLWGYTEWRLPNKLDTGSEMSLLSFDALGNIPNCDGEGNCNQPGWGLTNTGPFANIQADHYWLAQEWDQNGPNSSTAWSFDFHYGAAESHLWKGTPWYAWAVYDGDIGAAIVPIPAATWLFLSAIGGLLMFKSTTVSGRRNAERSI